MIRALTLCVLTAPLVAQSTPTAATAANCAFSLRAAAARGAAGERSPELMQLAGITRVAGFVQTDDGDIVLIGRRAIDLPPASLDDLAVALTARLRFEEWPYLSLDPTATTAADGLLAVTTSPGIHGTSMHADFLRADVFLKRYSLQQLGPLVGAPSYVEIALRDLMKGLGLAGRGVAGTRWLDEGAVRRLQDQQRRAGVSGASASQVRFWFAPRQPYGVIGCDGVFAIRGLQLEIRIEQVAGPQGAAPDPAAVAFAGQLSAQMQRLRDPAVTRLKVLYDLLAVAEGIRTLARRPELGWFLDGRRASADAKKTHPAIDVCAAVDLVGGGMEILQVSGGVDLQSRIQWLEAGDLSPLRGIVQESRPAPQELSWPLPLAGWRLPNTDDLPPPPAGPARALAAPLLAQRYSIVVDGVRAGLQPFGGFVDFLRPAGVSMESRSRVFQPDPDGVLQLQRTAAVEARPRPDSLAWPVPPPAKR